MEEQNDNFNGTKKPKLDVIALCSGIGCQERGIENTELFDVNVVATSEISKEAVLSYAAIHCGLTDEIVVSSEYPDMSEMRKFLTEINLGYVPEKDKKYNWYQNGKKFEENIRKYWLACKLSKNLGDISRIEQLPQANLWFISSPCFVEGTLVMTEDGYKSIEQISVGEKVLTHEKRWKPVKEVITNEANSLIQIKCMTSEKIHCTPGHPFYVRKRHRRWDAEKDRYVREFDEPEWVLAKDLTTDYYFGTAINQVEEIPDYDSSYYISTSSRGDIEDYLENPDFWYIIGRFIGDGWVCSGIGIKICANRDELNQITPYLDRLGWHYNIIKERTVYKINISWVELADFCEQFGKGALNKHLTKMVLNLPVLYLTAFLNGYIDADGYITDNGYIKIASISRELIYDVSACIHKAFHRPTSIYYTSRSKTVVIEGRVCNQHDTYTVVFKKIKDLQDKAFYENGYIWTPINGVNEEEYSGLVYNLSVENDESYMIQNIICHNCTDISLAGKLKGLNPDDNTRSSLIWQTIRLLNKAKETDTLPEYMMLENVKNLVGKKFIKDFETFNSLIEEFGYNVYWKVLNARDCGVPQNRERVFAIYIRKDIDKGNFAFPEPFDNGLRLKDVLEEEVDEKYYINTEKANQLLQKLIDDGIIGEDSNT